MLYILWKLYLVVIWVYAVVDLTSLLRVYTNKSQVESLSSIISASVCYLKVNPVASRGRIGRVLGGLLLADIE